MHIECPSCRTRYTPERCGFDLASIAQAAATVACVLCRATFDVAITRNPSLGWWARTVLRRTQPSHTVTSATRGTQE